MNRKQRKRQLARRRAHEGSLDRPRDILSRASYSTVKQGHIVPVTYQRNFAIEDQVAVHLPGEATCFLMNVRDAGKRSRFYRRIRPDGTAIDDIEASLDVIENKAAPLLNNVAGRTRLSPELKGGLAQFLAVQMLRGPAFFAQRRVDVERFVPHDLTTEHVKPALIAMTGGDMKLARQRVVELFQAPTQQFVGMLSLSSKVAAVLGSMRWQLLEFVDPLVAYSDQPVVVWPLGVQRFADLPRKPTFGPLGALEVRVPLSPHRALLMTWVDEPDAVAPVPAQEAYAAETNALVAAQADKQWMHMPGAEPPIALGSIRPLSRAFENGYTASAVRTSKRWQKTAEFLHRVRDKRFINDIEVVDLNWGTAA